MNKYNNPRLLNTVVSGTGMKNPVRPHVIIGSEKNGFIRGDLMDANAVKEAVAEEVAERVAEEVAERIDADLNLSEEIDTKVRQAVDDLIDGAPEALDTLKELSEAIGDGGTIDERIATAVEEETIRATSAENAIKGGSDKSIQNLDNRLSTMEELAEISVGGGTIGIASSEDFTNRTTAGDAKIPTVGAVLGGADDVPTPGSDNLVKSGAVFKETHRIQDIQASASSARAALKNDGSIIPMTTSSARVATFPVDANKIYYAKGTITNQAEGCGICYYDENEAFISYELDTTGVLKAFENYKLTIPQNAALVKINGHSNYNTSALTMVESLDSVISEDEHRIELLETTSQEHTTSIESLNNKVESGLSKFCESEDTNIVVFDNIVDNNVKYKILGGIYEKEARLLLRIRCSADTVIRNIGLPYSVSTSGSITWVIHNVNTEIKANKYYFYECEINTDLPARYLALSTLTGLLAEDTITVDIVNLGGVHDRLTDVQTQYYTSIFNSKHTQSFTLTPTSPYVISDKILRAVGHRLLVMLLANKNMAFAFALSSSTAASGVVVEKPVSLLKDKPYYLTIPQEASWSYFVMRGIVSQTDDMSVDFSVVDMDGSDKVIDTWSELLAGKQDMSENIVLDEQYAIYKGRKTAGGSMRCCYPIYVRRGDIIKGTLNSNMAIDYNYIFRTDEAGSYFTPVGRLWYGKDGFYVADTDGWIAFNVRHASYSLQWFRMPIIESVLDMADNQVQRYKRTEMIPILENLSHNSIIDNNIAEKPVTLLHFTDIHGGRGNLESIRDFVAKYKRYLSDVLCTGDMCAASFPDYYTDVYNADIIKDFLLTIGNHDVYDSHNHFGGVASGYDNVAYRATNTEKYAQYFANVGSWNVIQPENAATDGKCYYYKDYTTSTDAGSGTVSVEKLRLIVIDCTDIKEEVAEGTPDSYRNEDDGKYYRNYHSFDAAQLAWFTAALEDAKVNGYAVVAALHYPPVNPSADITYFDTAFNSFLPVATGSFAASVPGALAAVDSFVENGGEFVCWLCGHKHQDHVGMLAQHNNQIIICVGSANVSAVNLDVQKNALYDTFDQFNLTSIDVHRKLITVYRVGVQIDKWLRHKEAMVIDYANGKLIESY